MELRIAKHIFLVDAHCLQLNTISWSLTFDAHWTNISDIIYYKNGKHSTNIKDDIKRKKISHIRRYK